MPLLPVLIAHGGARDPARRRAPRTDLWRNSPVRIAAAEKEILRIAASAGVERSTCAATRRWASCCSRTSSSTRRRGARSARGARARARATRRTRRRSRSCARTTPLPGLLLDVPRRSRSSRAPTSTRCPSTSTRRRAGCTRTFHPRAPPPAGSPRATRTSRTSPSAARRAARSAGLRARAGLALLFRRLQPDRAAAPGALLRRRGAAAAPSGRTGHPPRDRGADLRGAPRGRDARACAPGPRRSTSASSTAWARSGSRSETQGHDGEARQFIERYFAALPGVRG